MWNFEPARNDDSDSSEINYNLYFKPKTLNDSHQQSTFYDSFLKALKMSEMIV